MIVKPKLIKHNPWTYDPPPPRKHDCKHYPKCLTIAADSNKFFTCKKCKTYEQFTVYDEVME